MGALLTDMPSKRQWKRASEEQRDVWRQQTNQRIRELCRNEPSKPVTHEDLGLVPATLPN